MRGRAAVISKIGHLVVLAALGTAAGCGTPPSAAEPESTTIKIAIIPPSAGALAQFGSDSADAWQYAVDEVNASGGVGGRQVELVRKDTDGSPPTTLRAAREAVTNDGARFIGAVMTSPEHGALNQQLEGLGALSFNSLGKDDALRGADCNPNAFHVVQSNGMDIAALADTLSTLPGDRWAIQAVDYSTGHHAAEAFTAAAAQAGKSVVATQFAPLGTTDFGTYISQIASSGADALFAVEFGADGVAFVNQAAQFNLPATLRTVLGFNMVSEPLFPALGDKVAGFVNNVGYDVAADNPLNAQFVRGFEERFDALPYYVHADNYLAARMLFAAIEKAGSAEPAQVRDALADLTFDSIAGTVTMRGADHQLVRPSYVGQVERTDAGLGFTLLTEVPGARTTPSADPACAAR